MSDDKRKTVCTIDHAAKQSDARNWDAYEYWLRQARRLRAARKRHKDDEFRRDIDDDKLD